MSKSDTLTRADLTESLQRQIGLSRAESSQMVSSILSEMTDALARGENVKISGFGTFLLRDKPTRLGRNPKTGVTVTIPPCRSFSFRASDILRVKMSQSG
jgi:integration host factor subunit alpha